MPGIFPGLHWSIPVNDRSIYITFDDGPTPGITESVLELLEIRNQLATFFCIGSKVQKFPELFQKIQQNGHHIGHHTYQHKNGWKTPSGLYFQDVEDAAKIIPSNLFRPPYGKMTPYQIYHLKRKYKIIMWTLLSYDWSDKINSTKILEKLMKASSPGSIVVFHDSIKAKGNLLSILPKYLEFCHQEELACKPIPYS